jgi:hypothetical protein
VAGTCEYGNELSGSVNAANFLTGCKPVSFSSIGGADKSLAPPGRKQATATEDFDFRISYL